MGRPINPRRAIVPTLRSMTSNIRYMVTVWAGRMAPEWKPETDRKCWLALALYMDTVARQAHSVADFARERASELPE